MNRTVYCIVVVSLFVIKISYAFALRECSIFFFRFRPCVSLSLWVNTLDWIFPIEQCTLTECKWYWTRSERALNQRCNHCRHNALYYSQCYAIDYKFVLTLCIIFFSLFLCSFFSFYGIRFHFLLCLSVILEVRMYLASLMLLLLGFSFVSSRLVYIYVIGFSHKRNMF